MRYVKGWGSGLLRVSASLVNNGLGSFEVIEDVVDVRVNARRRAAAEKVPIDDILSSLTLPFVTKSHVLQLFARFGSGSVFGRQHIAAALGAELYGSVNVDFTSLGTSGTFDMMAEAGN
jgi:hypothetical protein